MPYYLEMILIVKLKHKLTAYRSWNNSQRATWRHLAPSFHAHTHISMDECAHFNVSSVIFSCGPLTIRLTVRTQRRVGKTKANSTKNLFSQHSERQRWRFYSSSFILTSPSFMCVFGFERVKERLCLCTFVCLGEGGGGQTAVVCL